MCPCDLFEDDLERDANRGGKARSRCWRKCGGLRFQSGTQIRLKRLSRPDAERRTTRPNKKPRRREGLRGFPLMASANHSDTEP